MWKAIKKVLGSVWDFIMPFTLQLLTATGKIVSSVATSVVIQAATDAKNGNLNGKDITTYARDLMVSELKTKGVQAGVDIGMSFINACLEVALQKAKVDGKVE